MYKIIFERPAERFFRKLDKIEQERIGKKILELQANSELGKPLTGKLAGIWSLRIGDYRVLYQIKHDKLIILVLKIGHRKNVYS